MSLATVQEIEEAIDALGPQERVELFGWLEASEREFDERIAADFEAGKLDRVIEQALADHRNGLTTPLER